MEAVAKKRFIRQSPTKIRYVLKTVKGLNVNDAINKLSDKYMIKSCTISTLIKNFTVYFFY